MGDRLDDLEMRRRLLLLRSERLRAELAADQQLMLEALSGIDRAVSTARKFAPPLLLAGAGFLLFRRFFFGGGRRAAAFAAHAAPRAGLVARALFWVSVLRRALPYVPLIKALWRSRFSQRPSPEDMASSAQ